MPENCAGCRYWFLMRSSGEMRPLGEPSSHRRGLFGTCHRGPPVIVAEWSNPPGMGVWPTIQASDWCGEWRDSDEE